jgi:hypothetical protein
MLENGGTTSFLTSNSVVLDFAKLERFMACTFAYFGSLAGPVAHNN